MDAASHPKAQSLDPLHTTTFSAPISKATPNRPSFEARFNLAEKAATDTIQADEALAAPARGSELLQNGDISSQIEALNNDSAAPPASQGSSVANGSSTEDDGGDNGGDDGDDGSSSGGNNTFVYLSDVQPALEQVVASVRNLELLAKVITRATDHELSFTNFAM
jgi:hypothetical protein